MISALWQSFYSAPLYRLVQHWRAKALIYLGLLLVFCWTPGLIRFHRGIMLLFQRAQSDIIPKLPTVHFVNGRVTTEEIRPYLFYFGGDKGKMTAIIDTSGHYTSLEGQDAQMLLTSHKFFVRQKTGEMRMYDLSQRNGKAVTIDQEFLQNMIRALKRWVLAAIYLGVFVLSYLKRLIQAFFIALAGLLLASALGTDLDLGELFSLAIVSMTPAMIIETLAAASGKSYRFQWILWIILISGYFIFAINAASDKMADAEIPQ